MSEELEMRPVFTGFGQDASAETPGHAVASESAAGLAPGLMAPSGVNVTSAARTPGPAGTRGYVVREPLVAGTYLRVEM